MDGCIYVCMYVCMYVCGAGGNRTLVRRAVIDRATTIPEIAALRLPHRRVGGALAHRRVFPRCQRSFPPSAVFPAVILCFCCRAAVDWPRVPSRVAMTLDHLMDQAARAKSPSALLFGAPFKESEQLRSHERLPVSASKPISPLCGQPAYRPGGDRHLDSGPRASAATLVPGRLRHRPTGLEIGVALGHELALVVLAATSAEGQLDLGTAVLEVERKRDERKSFPIDTCAQPVDLVSMDEKLAVPVGFVTEDARTPGCTARCEVRRARAPRRGPNRWRRRTARARREATSPRSPSTRCRTRSSR